MPVKKARHATKAVHAPRPSTGVAVGCWEDDPGDPKSHPPLAPIHVPEPSPSAAPLPYKLGGAAPPPKVYIPGTADFLYYANSSAVRRAADFWGKIVPAGTHWFVGKTLPVVLDEGVDLNAFYTRGGMGEAPGLHFFHDSVGGRVYYSGESPDVACHETGHAVLDAIRPQLFNAMSIESAAFHESFGDMSALLTALQVPSFRPQVLQDTGGALNRSSRFSRLAEQLGAAIRVQHPDAVDPDCLRNASNSFTYRDPSTLPHMAPASQLSSEPHSFSRVFTAAFLDALAGIFKLQASSPGDADLVNASMDLARILIGGILDAPVVPDYYSQVAAHMVQFAEGAPYNGKYRDALKSSFVRRGILSLEGAAALGAVKRRGGQKGMAAARLSAVGAELPTASLSAAVYGLKRATVRVHTAEESKSLAVTAAAVTGGTIAPSSPHSAAQAYAEDLFQRGHVDVGAHADPAAGLVHPFSFKSHRIFEENGELVIKRRSFNCGFDQKWRDGLR